VRETVRFLGRGGRTRHSLTRKTVCGAVVAGYTSKDLLELQDSQVTSLSFKEELRDWMSQPCNTSTAPPSAVVASQRSYAGHARKQVSPLLRSPRSSSGPRAN